MQTDVNHAEGCQAKPDPVVTASKQDAAKKRHMKPDEYLATQIVRKKAG